MAKKTDEFVRRLMRVIEPSNFHWVEQSIKDLAEDAVSEKIEKLEKEIEDLKVKAEANFQLIEVVHKMIFTLQNKD